MIVLYGRFGIGKYIVNEDGIDEVEYYWSDGDNQGTTSPFVFQGESLA